MIRRLLTAVLALLLTGINATAATLGAQTDGHVYFWNGVAIFGILGTTNLTLLDIAKRLDPGGKVDTIVEMLSQTNEILADMQWKEGNLSTGERTTVRTGLPSVFWRLLNAGVATSKSTSAQIDEMTGMLEAYSQVDVDLAKLGGNEAAVRLSEARAFFESMNQEFASTLFYGTASAPEEFIGLAARYSALTGAGNSANVIGAGGTGSTDNTSIYLVAWDPETICGIYPKASKAGISHDDMGTVLIQNAGGVTGALMTAFVDHWQWKCGIALKDWRYVVRICNIDVSDLSLSTAADLLYYMADAEERIPSGLGRRAFYCNRTIKRYLRHQMKAAVGAGGGLTFDNVAGRRVMVFGETPVRTTDALLNTEDVVS